MSFRSKKDLELLLQKLKGFLRPSIKLEQYQTPAGIAAEWLWEMAILDDIEGKEFLDLGSGPGILGLGLLLLGAKKVHFVDKDANIMKICKENYEFLLEKYELGKAEFHLSDVDDFKKEKSDLKVDAVLQNPPFGTQIKHVDKQFLEAAFDFVRDGGIVYSMHKWSTKGFVEAMAKDFGFDIERVYRYEFRLAKTMEHHKKEVQKIDVGMWKMVKKS